MKLRVRREGKTRQAGILLICCLDGDPVGAGRLEAELLG